MSSHASVIESVARCSAELERLELVVTDAGVLKTAWTMVEDNETTVTINVMNSAASLSALVHNDSQPVQPRHLVDFLSRQL